MTWTRSGRKARADALENMVNPQKARKHALETEIDVNFIGIVRKIETRRRTAGLKAEPVPHKGASGAEARNRARGVLVAGFKFLRDQGASSGAFFGER